jgi:DNA-binding transcriptional regulator YhcF (GntR family)
MRDVFMTAVIETLFYIYFLTIKDITYLEARFSLICEILNKTKLFEVHKKEEEAKRKAAEEAKEAKEAEEAQKKELNLSDILLELQTKIDKKHNLKDIRTVIKFLSNKYNIYSNSLNIKTIELIHDELTFICCHEFRIFSNDPNIHKIIFGDKTFVNQESKYAQFLNEINTVILDKQLQSTEKLPSIHDINDVGIITDPNEINIRNMCKDFRNMIVKQVVHTTSQFLDISAEDHMFKTLYSTFSNTTKYTPSIVDTLNLNTGPEVPVTETNTLPEVLVIEQNAASEKRSKAEESMYLPILNIINNKVHVDYHDLKSLFDYVYISPAFKPYFFYSSKEDLLSTEEIVDYFIDHTYDTLPICVLNMFAETAASTTQDENQNDDEVSNIRTEFKYLTNTSARQPPSLLQKSASTSALANSVVFESPPNSNYGANPVHLRHSNSGVPPPKGGGARFPIKLKYTLLDYHKKYYPIYAATYYGNRKQKV